MQLSSFFNNLTGTSGEKLTAIIKEIRANAQGSAVLFMGERAPIIGKHVSYIMNELPNDEKALNELLDAIEVIVQKLKSDDLAQVIDA